MYSPLLFTTSSHLSTKLSMLLHQKSPGLVSKNLLSQFLRSSSLSKVTPSYGSTKSRKDSNLWVHGLENTAEAKGPPIRALGVWLWRLVQHEAWHCREEVWFGLVDEVFSVG